MGRVIKSLLDGLPSGARFYRCAFQINPYDYIQRYNKTVEFRDEQSYNNAIVNACLESGIEIIAVTDHYRVKSGYSLVKKAREAGIFVFHGFEAVTKDGVHLLCLFDPSTEIQSLERILGDCGIHTDHEASPNGKYDVIEHLEEAQERHGAVCIAAHVASDGGLLRVLSGQARVNAWMAPHLLACSLPGPISDAPAGIRPILENKNTDYKRTRPVAVINAQDVSGPEDLAKSGASCFIKMSQVSIEGLRQAFLDPESRIRLISDPVPEEHTELLGMAWQGGFLDEGAIRFNENLNVLIGGRGTGKSTVVESLRYVLGLEPLGDEARKTHEGIIRHVLGSGTKISLLVRSQHPTKHDYLIERTIPNPPIVRDENGNIINLTPEDIIGSMEIYGQHEIAELARSKEKRTRLLDRFVEVDFTLDEQKKNLKRQLERTRIQIVETYKEIRQVEEKLATLPGLEETLRRFQEAGLEEKLKEQSLLVREERIIKTADERLNPIRELFEQLQKQTVIDRAFLSPKALEDLPGKEILDKANVILEQLELNLGELINKMEKVILSAQSGLQEIRGQWTERKEVVLASYEQILRELQKTKVDGEEFIRLRRQIEDLQPLKERQEALKHNLTEVENERRRFLLEWEEVKAEEIRCLTRAAKKVNKKLRDLVSVEIVATGAREPLIELLREGVGGRLSETINIIQRHTDLSLLEFVAACREGGEALSRKFGIPTTQAERIIQAGEELLFQIEELELPPTTTIKLNIAAEEGDHHWQTLEELSTGQKATAILLLLLLESQAPLVVDQPEDDLDNRFIMDSIVPKMREEKRRRQFVFATHNANIPVIGDAEMIVGLFATGEPDQGKSRISPEYMGSIDTKAVREMVEDVLEGGKDAFETRRMKYGF